MTLEISDVSGRSARFTGQVSLSGSADGSAISQKGFAWSSDMAELNRWNSVSNLYYYDYGRSNPVEHFGNETSGAGSFEHAVNNLSDSTAYYVKAYAMVSGQIVFGETKKFTTRKGEPYLTVGSLNVQTADIGETSWSSAKNLCENSTVAGFGDWRLPTIGELATLYSNKENIGGLKAGDYWSSTVSSSSSSSSSSYQTLNFSDGNQENHSSSSSYYVRCVRTGSILSKPTVLTLAASGLTATGATLNGAVTSPGEPAYTERGFAYGTAHNPTTDNSKVESYTSRSDSLYSAAAAGLSMNTAYYVRAYATNSEGTAYGEEKSFTLTAQQPAVTTLPATNVGYTSASATLHGSIVGVGIPAYTERGFCYSSIFTTPTVDESKKAASGSGAGEYFANISGLTPDATYYVRAYATNSQGTAYGSSVSFSVAPALPAIATNAVSNLTETSVTLNASITGVGDPAYTERGFVYGTAQNPAVEDASATRRVVSGSGTGSFNANLTGLTTGTTYYVRAYATGSKGTAYGVSVSFKPASAEYVILSDAGLMVQKEDKSARLNWSSADALCENDILSGYTDWRLPTINELSTMYAAQNSIGTFKTDYPYWSSTYYSGYYYSSSYCYLFFSNGTQCNYGTQNFSNSSSLNCRCVRSLE